MKSTHRLAAATATAACALALAACSAGEGVPGLPGFGATGPAVTITERGPESCGDSNGTTNEAFCTPPAPTSQAPSTPPTTQAPHTSEPAPTTSPAPTTPATTPAPSTNSTDPTATEKAKPYGVLFTDDKDKYIDSQVPFIAGVLTPQRATYAAYAFERMDVEFTCPNPDALPPENGHFVRVFYFLGNSKADKETGPTLDVTAKTWGYLDADGKPWLGTLATAAAKKCLDNDDDTWGSTAKPGWIAGGELIFDLPSTNGTLQHTWEEGVGGWRFPVENANTTFRSLDERIAEQWK